MVDHNLPLSRLLMPGDAPFIIIIIIIINDIYIAQVRKGHKCAMSAEMATYGYVTVYVSIANALARLIVDSYWPTD